MPNERPTSPRTPTRPWFPLIVLLVPIVFFALLETGLRIAGYGEDLRQWIEVAPGKRMLNTEVGRRYFRSVRIIPMSNQDAFDIEKKPNAFRVFVLGESSGAGYPFAPVGAFSRWLRTSLELLYPDCTIEVVNLSMTAINSHTLRDLFPGVLDQQPDLVLVYAGHNEYYGALGVGSAESPGAHRLLVRVALALQQFRTYELARNAIAAAASAIGGPDAPQDGTLMSRMAQDQSIALGSPTYELGLRQFEENMRDILSRAREKGVPVILGELVSNLRDQRPFISAPGPAALSASAVFESAADAFRAGRRREADSLFRRAKDLDLLRFRAPEEMNALIRRLGAEFAAPVLPLDSLFASASPAGIVGDDLMTDHLHPTLDGYRLMGEAFLRGMQASGTLPACTARALPAETLRAMTRRAFAISRLDSVLGRYRIALLKNDWPYVDKRSRRPVSAVIQPQDEVERAAARVVFDELSWEAAHRGLAEWYLAQRDYDAFTWEMSVLISQFPVIVEYYDYTANELMKGERYDDAFPLLERRHAIRPSAFSAKWIGIILLSRGELSRATAMLEESLRDGRTDAQALYNLAGAYALSKDYPTALRVIDECLTLDPQFPKAAQLRDQLVRATR